MTTKIKTALLTVFFLFGLLAGMQAQGKHDFAIVKSLGNQDKILVSYNNAPYEQISIEQKNDYKGPHNYCALLEFVSSLTEKGWEVINVGQDLSWVTYYLKKKR